MFDAYAKAAKQNAVVPGRMFVYETENLVGPRFIINFPTKRHWKEKSRMEDIEAGLVDLVRVIQAREIQSIAIPPLGAGNGGLEWSEVRTRIATALASLPDVRVLLFEPLGEPLPEERVTGTERPRLTIARALFVRLMELYGIPDYPMTLLEVQKLAYLLQVAGESLRLNFQRAPYGPYADNLNQVLRRLEGHYLYGATDTKPGTVLRLAPGAGAEAEAFLRNEPDATTRLARVARLIEGFETPYGMEVLATVHWVASEAGAGLDMEECVRRVHRWSERKAKMMNPDHIQVALARLHEEGFVPKEHR
jgi:O-acetyl-ADP-ribose deacetylase (regulator of RNase III)